MRLQQAFYNSFPGQLILIDNGLTGSASTVFNQMGLLEKLHFDSNRLEGDINELLSGKSKLGKLHNVDSSPLATKSLKFRFRTFRSRHGRR